MADEVQIQLAYGQFVADGIEVAVNGSYLIATDDIFVDNDDGKLQDDAFRILFSVRFYFD